MSKSRRLFLSMQGDDDFWGNGDRLEEKKLPSIKQEKSKVMDDEDLEDRYYFKQNKLGRQQSESRHENEENKVSQEEKWNLRVPLEESILIKKEEPVPEMEESETIIASEEEQLLETSPSVDTNEEFYNNYRNYFQRRPEVIFLIRSMDENAVENYDKEFIDLYEKTRKSLEVCPNPELNQILRCECSSNTSTANSDNRLPNNHAVVVSNFREPDRRLGRYSKYYYHHNVGPEVYSRKVFVGGLPGCVKESDILNFFSRYGRLQVDWPSKHFGCKSDSDPSVCGDATSSFQQTSHLAMSSPPFGQINPFMSDHSTTSSETQNFGMNRNGNGGGVITHGMVRMMNAARNAGFGGGEPRSVGGESSEEKKQHHLGYVFLLFEKERSVRELVSDCFEEEEGLFITLESSIEPIRVQIRPWLLADAEFLMDFNVPINTKLVAFIGGVPRPLKAVELAHFFEQTYGNVVCVGIDIDNKFKYPRGSGRVAFSNYDAYVQAITDRYIVLDHEDIHKRVEIKPYFFHNQSCEECSSRYNRQYAPFFCPSLECFQYYCEPCWHKMHSHPSRFHHMPVVKGI
ncbi:CRE-CPB-2 protein [Caenorhabditis remanei]|uniref:Cytoplasmic polyadenylation element-binding protein 2 n=2 Tax=Caenorhabditis remanei TaxID=31234 RepID=CPB2_CAERE|nr:RecName: Full=Cytoplasmic polyadenylation element-binding protein 2 [Caenorhabditis remanei]AAT72420.1 CPB-2 [Caenorhabditis remanei]AAT72449.1 CPB-2 [Caenorhabditis remanei]EFP07545.1 CRE-CPB-2 protein [Caenorhabditis remanei]